jgi:plastocyanin
MKRIFMFWAAIGLIAALVAACGGSSKTVQATSTGASATSASGAPAASGAKVTIEGMKFGQPVTVPPGAQVTIVNNDTVEHSVTSQTAGAFDVEVEGKHQATLAAPSQPGDYPFYCKYHPSMKGTLTVT